MRSATGLFCARLLRDDRGISALEFAIVVPLLVLLAGGVTDLGLMLRDRGELSVALNAGTRAALLLGSSATTGKVTGAMSSASGLGAPATFSATAPACYCITSGTAGSTLSASTCSTTSSPITCSDGTTPGTYMTLTATYTYTPLMPGFAYLANTTLSHTASVRLK